ncbi:hypothetical protein EK21DRAFT_84984 [Setomelanomma holmii]|uniref:RRM domain-containing protein n=1 Tax=Setomelanomma holmii TaxID=210430 RepID=A0A9P4HJU9_9PLEO|nr:hypothetical protein EK21DRAFT_84984 [Setomelanomma holmii]
MPAECDYKMLSVIIQRRFEVGVGSVDVQAGNYELAFTNKRSTLVTAETDLLPGTAVTMAIIISTSTPSDAACPMPRCGLSKATALPGGALICLDCGVNYNRANKKRRRLEEVFDNAASSDEMFEDQSSHCVLRAHVVNTKMMATSAKIIADPITKMSRGYGVVGFTNYEDHHMALWEMQGVYCGNRPMRISHVVAG